MVANPEFLREGTAVNDFMVPSLLVVGGENRKAVEKVAGLYAGLPVEACLVTLRTAEMIKYACNCFHAVKITFANEIGALAATLGVPAAEVMETVCKDTKLNVFRSLSETGICIRRIMLAEGLTRTRLSCLQARPAFADVRECASRKRGTSPTGMPKSFGAGQPANRYFRLAFKENTDDVRESPTVTMIEYLVGKGKDIRVYDPHIQLDTIYGSNRNFLLSALPHIGRLMDADLDGMLQWAETILITQKPSAAMREHILATGRPVVDFSSAAFYEAALIQEV